MGAHRRGMVVRYESTVARKENMHVQQYHLANVAETTGEQLTRFALGSRAGSGDGLSLREP